jgi:hypothetical protein
LGWAGYALDSRPSPPEYAGMSLAAADLAQKLTQPLPTQGERTLRTVAEAANYVVALPCARPAGMLKIDCVCSLRLPGKRLHAINGPACLVVAHRQPIA